MSNPLKRLRYLPWVPLLWMAALTMVIVFGLEMTLGILIQISEFEQVLTLLFTPPLGMVMVVALGAGVGAIAVWLLETVRPDVVINSGVLWALVGCLLLLIFVRTLLPFTALIALNQSTLIGVVVGVFFSGRRYWH